MTKTVRRTSKRRSRKFSALAASATDTNAFISLVVYVLLKYNGNQVDRVTPHVVKWYAQAKPFLDERADVAAPLTTCFNMVHLGKTPKADKVEALAYALKDKEFLAFLDKSIRVTKDQIKFIKLLYNHTLADTQEKVDSTWTRIGAMVSSLQHPSLNILFAAKLDKKGNIVEDKEIAVPKDVTRAASELSAIVKSVAGRSNCYLQMREMSNLRASNPTLFSRYAALNKIVNTLAVTTIKKLILQSGKSKVSIAKLSEQLKAKGIPNNLPIGFEGGLIAVVSNKLVAYTAEGAELDRVPSGTVRMNPKYDAQTNNKVFVCMGTGDDHIRYRTLEMKTARRGSHFKNVEHYTKNAAKFRATWVKDLMKFDPKRHHGRPDREIVLAAMVDLLQSTSQRIGGKDNKTAGEETFGLTTMKVSHFEIKKSYIAYSYTGKKKATQSAKISTISSPEAIRLGQVMRALIEERKDAKGKKIPAKGPDDFVFTWRSGSIDKPVPASAVRDYMKDNLSLPMGPHGFRHSVATEMTKKILAKSKFKAGKATQKEVDTWVKEQLKEVGSKLHHKDTKGDVTGVTAMASYIDPVVMHKFYEDLGLRTIKGVPKVEGD